MKADDDPRIKKIKELRDSIPDREKAGETCKGLYKCYKTNKPVGCMDTYEKNLMKLKESSSGKSSDTPKSKPKAAPKSKPKSATKKGGATKKK